MKRNRVLGYADSKVQRISLAQTSQDVTMLCTCRGISCLMVTGTCTRYVRVTTVFACHAFPFASTRYTFTSFFQMNLRPKRR